VDVGDEEEDPGELQYDEEEQSEEEGTPQQGEDDGEEEGQEPEEEYAEEEDQDYAGPNLEESSAEGGREPSPARSDTAASSVARTAGSRTEALFEHAHWKARKLDEKRALAAA